MPNLSHTETAIIANGESLSSVVRIWPVQLSAIAMPAVWTAASLTFQGSIDGVNFFDLFNDSGDEYQISADASRTIVLNVPLPFPFIKIRSGTTGVPVNQGASRTITVICREGALQ